MKKIILFYVVYILLAILMEKLVPSTVCGAGGGISMIFLLVPITIILIAIRLIKYFRK
jgi:hypothetical protein